MLAPRFQVGRLTVVAGRQSNVTQGKLYLNRPNNNRSSGNPSFSNLGILAAAAATLRMKGMKRSKESGHKMSWFRERERESALEREKRAKRRSQSHMRECSEFSIDACRGKNSARPSVLQNSGRYVAVFNSKVNWISSHTEGEKKKRDCALSLAVQTRYSRAATDERERPPR